MPSVVSSPAPANTLQEQYAAYGSAYNATNALPTLLTYLYSLLPTMIAQMGGINGTTAYSARYYYPYRQPQPRHDPEEEQDVNERVSRAVPLENAPKFYANGLEREDKEEKAPVKLETLPLDVFKHALSKKPTEKKTKHETHVEQQKALPAPTNVTDHTAPPEHVRAHARPKTVELPITCSECGSKMKLVIGVSDGELETKPEENFCVCEDRRPKYICDCSRLNVPQICSVCNKIRRFPDLDGVGRPVSVCSFRQQQQTPLVGAMILRRSVPVSFRRNVFYSPENDRENLWNPVETRSTITKRYAIAPGEIPTMSYLQAAAEEAEHEPGCFCWRCRIFRAY